MHPDIPDRRARHRTALGRIPFENERGVSAISVKGPFTYFGVELDAGRPRADQELAVLAGLAGAKVSINLVKIHRHLLSFVVNAAEAGSTRDVLAQLGHPHQENPAVSLIFIHAAGMRGLSGIMSRISRALVNAQVPMLQTGDAPDAVFCLVDSSLASVAETALRSEFAVSLPPPPMVVQKFGGKSMGDPDARRLAAERVREARDAGEWPVVVVSAIGRKGKPYATDTLLHELGQIDPSTQPEYRERDLLMACGEIIATVIMAQTLKSIGLRAVALTGAQAGILTDDRFGDAQIIDIDPRPILEYLESGEADVVVVAGFQGATRDGQITTLGRGGSDTTAAALGVALRAQRVEIYTHVDGVMTADPEVAPGARTLPVVTYEEVCEMAHQGAKVLHPRAAEIARMHGLEMWVKSSFSRNPGTRVAGLSEMRAPIREHATGVATLGKLVYFTVTGVEETQRGERDLQLFTALGECGISFYLNSIGPGISTFLVDADRADGAAAVLQRLGTSSERVDACELVSVIGLEVWEEPGFLHRIARTLKDADIEVLQIADSEKSVACLVRETDGRRAVQVLHAAFNLETRSAGAPVGGGMAGA